jgi:hypothetical protein
LSPAPGQRQAQQQTDPDPSPGLTHETLLILARQFQFSGGRISSQQKKRDRCNINFKLNIFSSNKSLAIINASEDHPFPSENALSGTG